MKIDWSKFFALVDKIVTELPGTWQEKAEMLKRRAREWGSETNLEEIASWLSEKEPCS